MGTGTRDILEQCRSIGLRDPEFIQEENLRVILWRKEKGDEGVNEGVNEIIDVLTNTEGLNAQELASKIDKSDATTERYLRVLREIDIVEFRSAPKTGGYYFTEKVNRILNE